VFLSDNVNTPTIIGMERSTVFALDRAAHNMRRANAAILETTAQLTERVDRLCHEAGIGGSGMSDAAASACATIDRVVANLQKIRL
jgi:hypothetical protein